MIGETKLIRRSSRELFFKHQHVWGWIYAAIGLMGITTGSSDWWTPRGKIGGLLVLGVGLIYACRRDQLSVDLEARTFRRQRGTFWASQVVGGSIDGIDVVLAPHIPRSSWIWDWFKRPEKWRVELAFRVWPPVLIETTADESAAYASLEHHARLLGLPALSRTADGEQRLFDADRETKQVQFQAPEEDVEPVVTTGAETPMSRVPTSLLTAVGSPPATSGIELRGDPGREKILLPPILPRWFLVVTAILSLASIGLGIVTLRSAFESVRLSFGAMLPGLVCVAFALLVWLPSLRMACGRRQIERLGNFLRFSTTRHGRRHGTFVLHRREIQQIDLRRSIVGYRSRKRQLFVRSERGILRAGHHLDRRSLDWLLAAVRAMTGQSERQPASLKPSWSASGATASSGTGSAQYRPVPTPR